MAQFLPFTTLLMLASQNLGHIKDQADAVGWLSRASSGFTVRSAYEVQASWPSGDK